MARMARVVIPSYPHHVTQRGNRRQKTFFCEEDYLAYLELLVDAKNEAGVEIWAYCLMPNHVHLVIVPQEESSLAAFFGRAHRRYTRRINFREDWRGHLWQERFHSFIMDEQHLLAAVRYTELNPVRAGLCVDPREWPWSSVHAHLAARDDELLTVEPMLNRVTNWREYLLDEADECRLDSIRQHARTGRPLGSEDFVNRLEQLTGLKLSKGKPGPKLDK